MIEVYPINTPVILEGKDVKGKILEILIKGTGVDYLVVWWVENNRYTAWMGANEFSVKGDQEKKQIGFIK